MNNQNQILVEKNQELYVFYLLKTVSWTEDRRLNSLISGHEVQQFSIWSSKRYEVAPNCDIFLLVQDGTLELCFQRRLKQKETRQKNYQFTKHSHLPNWWIGKIEEKDLELLITNNFGCRISLSHQTGEEFKKAYSFYV